MRTSAIARLLLSSLLGVAACSGGEDDEPPVRDGGVRDGGEVVAPRDGGFRDAGSTDAGPPPDSGVLWYESSCADCATGCPGGMCLTARGESFCADECGGDLDGCIDGYVCFDITNGMGAPQHYCLPPGTTCEPDDVNYGTSCYGDATGCGPERDWCEGDHHALGYCTTACATDRDCPQGFACGLGDDFVSTVCLATRLAGAEYCGRRNDLALGETPCTLDRDCAANRSCVRSEPTLPGVCAPPCGDGCADGTTCTPTARGDVCLSRDCECHGLGTDGERDLLAEALANVELTRCSLIWDTFAFANLPKDILVDPYRLSWFDDIHNEPLRGPGFAKSVVADLDDAIANDSAPERAAAMVERLAALVDHPAIFHPRNAPNMAEPLTEAVVDLISATGGTPDRAAILADAQDVPMDLQLVLAEIIDAVRRADEAQKTAVPSATTRASLYQYGPAFIAPRSDRFGLNVTAQGTRTLLNETLPYGELYGAAVELLNVVGAADLSRFAAQPTSTSSAAAAFLFVQDTPIGRIAIGDAENGIYEPIGAGEDDAWALLVDLGGDDVYRIPAGGNVSDRNSVSVLVDLGGDDRYAYVEVPHPLDGDRLVSDAGGRYTPTGPVSEDNGPTSFSDTPRQGGARMGTAMLIDLGGGDDHYQSLRMSQGTGVFGAGVLVDDDGDDTYLGEAAVQGASAFGIGLLYDGGGNDERRAYQFAQGFAYARAAGLLYDVDGDDIYFLDPGDPDFGGDPLYLSGQRPGRANSSLGQGFAFGRRADFSDRAFMSGGIGLLVDAAGHDRYDASIFAQGGGFWFGTGILADHAGNDAYDALWYAMGTGAHYALGYLLEGGGNDTYGGVLPPVNVTIAGAHDFTAAFLIDESGDDVYYGSRITLGAGNVNGIGVFVDNAGDDEYRPRNEYGIGNAALSENTAPGNARRKVKSIGVFVDAGGNDLYEVNAMPPVAPIGDDRAWQQLRNEDPGVAKNERGTGIDGDGESTLHAR